GLVASAGDGRRVHARPHLVAVLRPRTESTSAGEPVPRDRAEGIEPEVRRGLQKGIDKEHWQLHSRLGDLLQEFRTITRKNTQNCVKKVRSCARISCSRRRRWNQNARWQ